MKTIRAYLQNIRNITRDLDTNRIFSILEHLVETYDNGQQAFFLGNGGSAANCSHIVNDFQKGILLARGTGRPFRCMALVDNVPVMTAWANDLSYEEIFSQQLRTWCNPKDLAIFVSGSGNSPNILRGAEAARELGAYTVALTGFDGGKLAPMVDEALVVPSQNMQQIEDIHMIVMHILYSRMETVIRERRDEKQ